MPDTFQVSFLNGLEMARSVQGAKLDTMQRGMEMQYQIASKQMDFQMNLLKLREAQAAQQVEMRMAQDEHQLKLKDFALRVKESELRSAQLSQAMETQNVTMYADAAISGLESKLALMGADPSSPEFHLGPLSAVKQGALAGMDPKIANMVGSKLSAKLRATQEGFFNNALDIFDKINASRQVTVGNEETGISMTDKMFGVADKGKLRAVAEMFRRGAVLGHEPSQRMYGEVMALVDGVSAPAAGVQPAASAAAGVESKYAMPLATTPYRPGMSDTDFLRGLASAQKTAGTGEVQRYADTIQTKLAGLSAQLASDPQAALGVKQLRDRVELARRASAAKVEGRSSLARQSFAMGTGSTTVSGMSIEDLRRLSEIQDPLALARELQRVVPATTSVSESDFAPFGGY